MSYATRRDFVARFGVDEFVALGLQALDEDGDPISLNHAGDYIGDDGTALDPQPADVPRMSSAIADAAAQIDGRLALAYALPLPDGTYPLLVAIAADLARLRLYDESAPEHVTDRARRARRLLEDVVEGKSEVVAAGGAPVERRASARFVGRDREFTVGSRTGGELQGLDNF